MRFMSAVFGSACLPEGKADVEMFTEIPGGAWSVRVRCQAEIERRHSAVPGGEENLLQEARSHFLRVKEGSGRGARRFRNAERIAIGGVGGSESHQVPHQEITFVPNVLFAEPSDAFFKFPTDHGAKNQEHPR